MKPVKSAPKYFAGGITDDRSPRKREMDRQRKAKRIKELEGLIAGAKGTPAVKGLIHEYRTLTNTHPS